MKTLYLVRHCQASGQAPEAALTESGLTQAQALAERLTPLDIQRVVSSPWRRAYQTAAPLAHRKQLPVETEERLIERELGLGQRADWLARLEETYQDFDLHFEAGETNREAQQRGMQALNELLQNPRTTMVVTHGGMLSLLLNYYDNSFGFTGWQNLTNPDVYCLEISESRTRLERLWS